MQLNVPQNTHRKLMTMMITIMIWFLTEQIVLEMTRERFVTETTFCPLLSVENFENIKLVWGLRLRRMKDIITLVLSLVFSGTCWRTYDYFSERKVTRSHTSTYFSLPIYLYFLLNIFRESAHTSKWLVFCWPSFSTLLTYGHDSADDNLTRS